MWRTDATNYWITGKVVFITHNISFLIYINQYKKAKKTRRFGCSSLEVIRMNLHQMRNRRNKKITHFINFLLVLPAAVLPQEGLRKEKALVTHLNKSELIINYHSLFSRGLFFFFLLTRSFVCSSRFSGISVAPVTWPLAERFPTLGGFWFLFQNKTLKKNSRGKYLHD